MRIQQLALAAVAPLATIALLACDSGAGRPQADRRVAGSTILDCDTTAGGAAVNVAVTEYIKLAKPTPQRFLSSVGAGATPMPESGFRALKDKGPTYYYPADSAGQATVKAKLADVGNYASLLVTFGDTRVAADGNAATVRLGGRYVGGDHDGVVAPTRAVRLRCEGATWVVVTADEERTT
jgi:hypothetical protein